MAAIRRRVKAHGRVQGVFFRDSTREEAQTRGVAGWVRNCEDGTVEAVFEGEPDDVEALVWFVRSGPGQRGRGPARRRRGGARGAAALRGPLT